jgi:hypothetical protein
MTPDPDRIAFPMLQQAADLLRLRLPRKGEHSARIRTAQEHGSQKKQKRIPVARGGAVARPSRRGGSAPRRSPQTQVGSAVIVPIITLSMLIAVFSAMVWALATR